MCDSSSEEDVAEFGDCDEQDAAVQRPVKKKRVQVLKQCSEDGCNNEAHKQGRCGTCHRKAAGEDYRTFCPGDGKTVCPYRVVVSPNKNRYDNHCPRCFVSKHANSTDPTLRERVKHVGSCFRAREMAVRNFLRETFPEYRWVFDRRITGHLTRPDAKTVVSDRVIVVEIDEDSHRPYFCDAERARERNILTYSGRRQVVLLRFNPDAYTREDGTRVPTCFHESKLKNSVAVNPKQKAQWDARLDYLATAIRMWADPEAVVPEPQEGRPVFTHELYYDNIKDTVTDEMRDRIKNCFKKQKTC